MPLPKAQNNSLAAINALPEDALAYIFRLAADMEGCVQYSDEDKIYPSVLLNSLPQVCSYWRQVSTGLCSLWSHIDLIDWGDPCDRLYNRARLWAKRAQDGPLDIHIYGHSSYDTKKYQDLSDFLAPLMKQVRSLEMQGNVSPRLIQSAFDPWFSNGTPGTLRRISLSGTWRIPLSYVRSTLPGAGCISSQRPRWPEQFEEFFRPVTVLRLRGAIPPLHSHAYHDLVELKLHAKGIDYDVTQIQLMAALSSSPRLRTLVIGVHVTDPIPKGDHLSLVRLENLEELGVIELPTCHFGIILGLLSPGSKPLTMSIDLCRYRFPDKPDADVDDFFQRSKVVALCIRGSSSRGLFPLAFKLLSHLHTLFLHDQDDVKRCLPEDNTNSSKTLSTCLQLRNFYASGCDWYVEDLKDFVVSRSVSVLGMHDCLFVNRDGAPNIQLGQMQRIITQIHPHVKHLNSVDFEDALRIWDFVI